MKKTSDWCHENVHGLDGNEGGNERDGGNVVVVVLLVKATLVQTRQVTRRPSMSQHPMLKQTMAKRTPSMSWKLTLSLILKRRI